MKAAFSLVCALMLTFGMTTNVMAHCGTCGPKDVTTSCKKKCEKAKDKKACMTKCKKKHDDDHKKKNKLK